MRKHIIREVLICWLIVVALIGIPRTCQAQGQYFSVQNGPIYNTTPGTYWDHCKFTIRYMADIETSRNVRYHTQLYFWCEYRDNSGLLLGTRIDITPFWTETRLDTSVPYPYLDVPFDIAVDGHYMSWQPPVPAGTATTAWYYTLRVITEYQQVPYEYWYGVDDLSFAVAKQGYWFP